MRILGIDPGLKTTGYGIIDFDSSTSLRVNPARPAIAASCNVAYAGSGDMRAREQSRRVEHNTIKLIETGVIEPKQKDVIENRIHKIYKNLDAILLEHQPHIMVLEKLYAHYKHPTTACLLGHVRGVICLLCAVRNMTLVEYAVKRIRKALTGNGNAPKLQTRSMVARMLKIDEEKLTLDASDALALALGHTYIIRAQV